MLLKRASISAILLFLLLVLSRLLGVLIPSAPVQLPVEAEAPRLYSNQTGDDLSSLYLAAIGSARTSIIFIIYTLTDREIIAALKQKAAEGIPVLIICDAKAAKRGLKQGPNLKIVKRSAEGLTHPKILIIDESRLLIGSANMTRESLKLHGNLVVGLYSQQLGAVLSAKARSMEKNGGSEPLLHQRLAAGGQEVEFWMLPDDAQAVQRMLQLFRGAKKTIEAALFTWTRQDFAQELIAASKRGVRVSVVMDRYSGRGASAQIVDMLQRNQIPTRLSTGQGLLHHKLVCIDREILVTGSANWTYAAFARNDDCFLVIHPLNQEQQTKMEQLYQNLKIE